jgi:hypothetical protein
VVCETESGQEDEEESMSIKKRLCGEDWHDLMTWEEYLENIMVMSKTCLLEVGHEGEHEWTDDDKWGVSFK